jgi:hypothetical protein
MEGTGQERRLHQLDTRKAHVFQCTGRFNLVTGRGRSQLIQTISAPTPPSSVRFPPSVQPSRRSASRKTGRFGSVAGVLKRRTPIRHTFPVCCASTAGGAAQGGPSAALVISSAMKRGYVC